MAGLDLSDLLPVGVVGKPHGTKGEMRVHFFDSSSRSIHSVDRVILQSKDLRGSPKEMLLQGVRRKGKELVLHLDGVDSRSGAELLKGHTVLLPKSSLPKLSEDEYYDFELLGLLVQNEGGEILGEVKEVEHPPSSDVLVVELTDGQFVDMPMVEPFVQSIDVADRRITVELPDELPRRSRR